MLLVAFAAPLHLSQGAGAHAADARTIICHNDQAGDQSVDRNGDEAGDPVRRAPDQPCCDFCTLSISPGLVLAYVVTLLDWPRPIERVAAYHETRDLPRITPQAARSRAPPMRLV